MHGLWYGQAATASMQASSLHILLFSVTTSDTLSP